MISAGVNGAGGSGAGVNGASSSRRSASSKGEGVSGRQAEGERRLRRDRQVDAGSLRQKTASSLPLQFLQLFQLDYYEYSSKTLTTTTCAARIASS